MTQTFRLQALEISEGWFIGYQQFYDIEPTKENVENIEAFFTEDIFQFRHDYRNRVIDLSWWPEHDWENGQFVLVVYEGDFTGKLLYELKTKDKAKIVAETNRLLSTITDGKL